jgi:hypothetical protein
MGSDEEEEDDDGEMSESEVDDDGGAEEEAVDDDEEDGSGPRTRRGDGAARRRQKVLARTVDAAGARGMRCPVCAQPVGVEPFPDSGALLAGVPGVASDGVRKPDVEWQAAVAVKCEDCGVVAHAGCVGASEQEVKDVMEHSAASVFGAPWRCQVCKYHRGLAAAAGVEGGVGAPAVSSPSGGGSGGGGGGGSGAVTVPSSPACCLCPVRDDSGPMLLRCPKIRVVVEGSPSTGPVLWAHLNCALWGPAVLLPRGVGNEGVAVLPAATVLKDGFVVHPVDPLANATVIGGHGAAKAVEASAKERCHHCQARGGVLCQVRCGKSECVQWAHPPCALAMGLYIEHMKPQWEKGVPRAVATVLYCRYAAGVADVNMPFVYVVCGGGASQLAALHVHLYSFGCC